MQKIPSKRFSQNFLQDDSYISRIIAAISPTTGDNIVEIGPGLGALTSVLLNYDITLNAIEVDNELIPILNEKFAKLTNFTLHHQDVLKFDFATFTVKQKVIGNLPYNISTPIIFKLLSYSNTFNYMIFMLQEEVVDRLCAIPNNKAYGRLSVMAQYHCKTEKLFTVPANAFYPIPKVTSAIIKLTPYQINPFPLIDHQVFEKIVTASFNQRRKTIANSLKNIASKEAIEAANIDPMARAENLNVKQFIDLANFLSKND